MIFSSPTSSVLMGAGIGMGIGAGEEEESPVFRLGYGDCGMNVRKTSVGWFGQMFGVLLLLTGGACCSPDEIPTEWPQLTHLDRMSTY